MAAIETSFLPIGYQVVNSLSNCKLTIALDGQDIIQHGVLYLATKMIEMNIPSSISDTNISAAKENRHSTADGTTSAPTPAPTTKQDLEVACFVLFETSQQSITWEQVLFTDIDILAISKHQFGFKCKNQYISVETSHPIYVFIENSRFLKRCVDLEHIKLRKQAIQSDLPQKVERKGITGIFSRRRKKQENSKARKKEEGFVPWDYLPPDYHPMLIANGITEKEWNTYGAKLMPVLTDFSTKAAVETIQISSFTIQSSIHSPTDSDLESPQLPEGWAMHYDEVENQYYYFNEVYEYSQWDYPSQPAQFSSPDSPATATEDNTSGLSFTIQLPKETSNYHHTEESKTNVWGEVSIPEKSNVSVDQYTTQIDSKPYEAISSTPISNIHDETKHTVQETMYKVPIPSTIPTFIPPLPPIDNIHSTPTTNLPPVPPISSIPPPPPIGNIPLPPPPPPLPANEDQIQLPQKKERRGSRAAPPKPKPVPSKSAELLASIREFSKSNLRHVDPKSHAAPDLSKMATNQKLSLMEVLRSKLSDLREHVDGSGSDDSSSDDSGNESDASW